MTRHKLLYIPIEEGIRDLEPRLLLTRFALHDGWTVVIGQQWLMHAAAALFPSGVFFFKGANQRQKDWMLNARSQGHAVVAIEEEATAIAEPLILKRQMAAECPDLLDLYLAQGTHHAQTMIEAHPGLENRVHEVGVSRFDLLRSEFLTRRKAMVDKLVAKNGDFILINTNFGYANSHWGSPEEFFNRVVVGNGLIDQSNQNEVELFANRLEFERHTMNGFVDLIGALSGDARIVVRPHLAENMEVWDTLQSDQGWGPNVEVVREGPAIDWILASRLLIQNSCTTGIEAAFMGQPVISFVPYVNDFLSCFIGNQTMPLTSNKGTVIDLALQAVSTPFKGDAIEMTDVRNFDGFYTRPDSGLITSLAWRTIHDKFDYTTVSGNGDIFSLNHLELDEQPDWSQSKFKTDVQQVQNILAYFDETLGENLAAKCKLIGDNLFALAPR